MQRISVPWGSWHGDGELELGFPKGWQVEVCHMHNAPDIGEEEVRKALVSPLGTPPLAELAQGRRNAAILADDISRPTPIYRLLPPVLDMLNEAGIDRSRVRIIATLGAHRPMVREEFITKLGREVVETVEVLNHHPYENLVGLGRSSRGTPIYVNRAFAEADLKLALSAVLPHGLAGFGGGAKAVLPGVVGMETITLNHSLRSSAEQRTGEVEDNEARADMEEIARRAGLEFSVNAVLTARKGIAGLFAGDLVQAHRAAADMARRVYSTPLPVGEVEVALFNAYPKDTELVQMPNCLHPLHSARRSFIVERGTVVLMSASPEGRGFHSLADRSVRGLELAAALPGKRVILFSPDINIADARARLTGEFTFCQSWSQVVEELERRYPRACRVAVFPCASMQLGGE